MARNEIHVGLEIGTSKIAVAVGETRGDGSTRIIGAVQCQSKGVRKGEIFDMRLAQTCLQDILFRAEERSDVSIRSVILAVTGSHVLSTNSRASITISGDHNEITPAHIDEVKRTARDIAIPQDMCVLHQVLQHYHVDGQENVKSPVGRIADKLECSFHIVLANVNRVMNGNNLVRELQIDVNSMIFSPLASAQVVLNHDARTRGVVVIDIGGGTTDYAVYRDDAVVLSGCIPVAGDHITNDISQVLNLPLSKAEQLKVSEGCAIPGDPNVTEHIIMPDDHSFTGRTIERLVLDSVINARVEEIFELLRKRIEAAGEMKGLGAGVVLTGGTSQLIGIDRVANQILGLPVQNKRAASSTGNDAMYDDPTFSTVIGLIRSAQLQDDPPYTHGPVRRWMRALRETILGSRS